MSKTPESLEDAVRRVLMATSFEPDRPRAVLGEWRYGDRVRAIEDDDEEQFWSGDEGYIVIEEVGAPEHNNVRTVCYFLVDNTDCPVNFHPDAVEDVS